MCDPWMVTVKKDTDNDPEQKEENDAEMEDEAENGENSDKNALTKRRKMQFFKYWPKHVL